MSKPIDQERALFEAHYRLATLDRDPISGAYYDNETRCLWDAWQARASVQPAGGAVPESEIRKVVTDAMVSMVAGVTGLVPPSGPGAIPDFVQAPIDRAVTQITKLLSTATHPESGEQKAVAVVDENDDGQWADILPDASVRVGDKLYAAPPVAQDVAGLAEAVRDYLSAVHEQLPNPLKVTAAMLQMKKALAAHRAQQGGA